MWRYLGRGTGQRYKVLENYIYYTHTHSSIARLVYFMYFNIYVLLHTTQKHIQRKSYVLYTLKKLFIKGSGREWKWGMGIKGKHENRQARRRPCKNQLWQRIMNYNSVMSHSAVFSWDPKLCIFKRKKIFQVK